MANNAMYFRVKIKLKGGKRNVAERIRSILRKFLDENATVTPLTLTGEDIVPSGYKIPSEHPNMKDAHNAFNNLKHLED